MEFNLAKDVVHYFNRSGNGDYATTVILEQVNVIQRDIKDGGSAVDTKNPEYIKLKECIGMLTNPEVGAYQNRGYGSCRYCGNDQHSVGMNENVLELKLSSQAAESAVSSGVVEDPLKLDVVLSGHALKVLKVGFGERIKIGVEFNFQIINNINLAADGLFKATSKMTIMNQTGFKDFCEGGIDLPVSLKNVWLQGQGQGGQIRAKLSVIAYLGNAVDPQAEEVLGATKQILDGDLGSDMQIICGDGKRVHCNSGFLMTQSEVLKSMLLSDMKEGKSKEVLMDDMSLEGVQAFMGYLYFRGKDSAENSCEIAVELIKAGNKYFIESLEKKMKEILMEKPCSWFEVDAALTLFFFVSKLSGYEDLKMKTIQVLKAKSQEIQSSAVFNRIFQENVAAAKEIFQAVLSA